MSKLCETAMLDIRRSSPEKLLPFAKDLPTGGQYTVLKDTPGTRFMIHSKAILLLMLAATAAGGRIAYGGIIFQTEPNEDAALAIGVTLPSLPGCHDPAPVDFRSSVPTEGMSGPPISPVSSGPGTLAVLSSTFEVPLSTLVARLLGESEPKITNPPPSDLLKVPRMCA